MQIEPTFLPILLTGGIGDVIMSIDSVRRLQKEFQVAVYTPHIEVFKYFSPEPITLAERMPDYTWHLKFHTTVSFHFTDAFSGFLVPEHRELHERQKALLKKDPYLSRLVHEDNELSAKISYYGVEHGWDRREFPLKSLGYEDEVGFTKLPPSAPNNYITVHDGYDTSYHHKIDGRSTKQLSPKLWEFLIARIRRKFPKTKIIQLGADTSEPIRGVDQCLIGETTLLEAFGIIRHAKLHVDGDSGLVHAATKMGVTCTVRFGPTLADFYGYKENENASSGLCSISCHGLQPDWMNRCPLYEKPICMG